MVAVSELRKVLEYCPETGAISWLVDRTRGVKAGDRAGSVKRDGYRQIRCLSVVYQEHRVAWAIASGRWPVGPLDHINGDRADNRLANLRECTNSQNAENKPKHRNNTTGQPGVCFHKQSGRFMARIAANGVRHQIGLFATAAEAGAAYANAKRELHRFAPIVRGSSK